LSSSFSKFFGILQKNNSKERIMKLKIKELREEYRLTQKELAEKLGNVQRNISNWENGTSEPDCETILKLADIFNVSVDELFGRDDYGYDINSNNGESTLYSLIRRLDENQAEAIKSLILSFKK